MIINFNIYSNTIISYYLCLINFYTYTYIHIYILLLAQVFVVCRNLDFWPSFRNLSANAL